MIPLYKVKILRFYSIISCTFASKAKKFVFGDLKPSHFCFQTQLLCTHITSETSANQHNFTVTYLINSCGLSPEDAISASKRVKLQSPERADSVLALLRNHGLSGTQISRFVRSRPRLLSFSPEKTLVPKLEFLNSIGISTEDLARMLVSYPHLMTRSLEKHIIPIYNFLRSTLSEENVVPVIKRGSLILSKNQNKDTVANIGLLRKLGMPSSHIALLLTNYPQVVMHRHENFGEVVDEVKEMGFNLEKTTVLPALRALCDKKSIWKRSSRAYRRWGWSEGDILSAFRKYPQCMITSEKKIMQVMDFLVNKVGWPSAMVAKNPLVLTFSLEKRIIPSCWVVKVLMMKGLENENLSLRHVLSPVEKQFVERFVTRYLKEVPQLWNVYQRKVDIQDV